VTTAITEAELNAEVWTEADKRKAWKRGWDIFVLDNGFMQIQALDDAAQVCDEAEIISKKTFDGPLRDFKATAYVYDKAAEDSPLHLKAIRIMENHNQRPWDDELMRLGMLEVPTSHTVLLAAYCIDHSIWFRMEPQDDDMWQHWYNEADTGVRQRLERFLSACS